MNHQPKLNVIFFCTDRRNEPVRRWLRSLDNEDKKTIGGDIQMVQYRWPLDKPLVKKIKGYQDLWEVRSRLENRRIARIFFTVHGSTMTLLHGFMKKTQKTPRNILAKADKRKNLWKQEAIIT